MSDEGFEPPPGGPFGGGNVPGPPTNPWSAPQPGMPPPPATSDGVASFPPPPPTAPYGQAPYGQAPAPYGQAPFGQQPYGQAPYGRAPYQAYQNAVPANPYESRGGTVMVLGILSLVLGVSCGIGALLGPVAWIMGNNVKSEAEAAGFLEPSNNRTGRICGIISTALMLVGVVLMVVFFIAAAASGTSSGYNYN